MRLTEVRAAIEQYLASNWPTLHADVPIRYENTATVDLATQETPFIGVTTRYVKSEQVSLGDNPTYRYQGYIYLDVYVKELTGTQIALTLLDDLTQLFRSKVINGVHTRTPMPAAGLVKDGWMRQSMNVPFWFDTQ